MFKNVAGQKFEVFAFDSATGLPYAGDAANITAYIDKDDAGVNALSDTSATEKSSTNAKGWYSFDGTQAETNADKILLTGKSSTSGIVILGRVIYTRPNKFTSMVIDAAGLVDATMVKSGPSGSATAQTTGDVFALLTTVSTYIDTEVASIKAKTDNLPADTAGAFTTVNSTLATIAGYIDTEVAAIKAKTDNLPSDTAATLATIAGYIDTEVAAIKAKTDNLPADTAGAFTTVNGTLATIAGYIDTEVAAIKAKTDNLPSDPADASDIAALIAAMDVWIAFISMIRDGSTDTDRYSVTLSKNATELTAATITVPRITVKSGVDNSTLINAGTLTTIGANARFKYDATGGERQATGVPYIESVTATVDGTPRTFVVVNSGRDST